MAYTPARSAVGKIIAITSCKGGVGKSTVSLELAFRLAARGHAVGLFDADVHGPSLPSQLPPSVGRERVRLGPGGWSVEPLSHAGVKLMSFGWLKRLWGGAHDGEVRTGSVPEEIANQLLQSTHWGALDYLVIDSPPGTGGVQKALYTKVPLAGAVVVTTPSPLATVDVVRGVHMLQRFNVPVLALVENMASFRCGSCDTDHFPFGQAHIRDVAASLGPAAARVPVFSLAIAADVGAVRVAAAASGAGGTGGAPAPGRAPAAAPAAAVVAAAAAAVTEAGAMVVAPRLAPGPIDALAAAVEAQTAGSAGACLPYRMAFSEQAHWPTVLSAAETTTC